MFTIVLTACHGPCLALLLFVVVWLWLLLFVVVVVAAADGKLAHDLATLRKGLNDREEKLAAAEKKIAWQEDRFQQTKDETARTVAQVCVFAFVRGRVAGFVVVVTKLSFLLLLLALSSAAEGLMCAMTWTLHAVVSGVVVSGLSRTW
jgi:hypothetical protein